MSKIKRIIEIDENVLEAIKSDNAKVCCTENIIMIEAIKNSKPYTEVKEGRKSTND